MRDLELGQKGISYLYLEPEDRDRYIKNILPLVHPGSQFLFWCFGWHLRRWEKLFKKIVRICGPYMNPGETQARFENELSVERIGGGKGGSKFYPAHSVCLMVKN